MQIAIFIVAAMMLATILSASDADALPFGLIDSPPIPAAGSWNFSLPNVATGDIIRWGWGASTTYLNFSLILPDANYRYGLASMQGIIADLPGDYTLHWRNDGSGSDSVFGTAYSITPEIAVWSPTPDQVIDNQVLEIKGNASRGTDVWVGLDSSNLVLADKFYPSYIWSTNITVPDGRHEITVKANFYYGVNFTENYSVVVKMNVTVDTAPPALTIISPIADSNTTDQNISIRWAASDLLGQPIVEFKMDGWDWQQVNGTEINLVLPIGSHLLKMRATDGLGHQSVESLIFTINAESSGPPSTPNDPQADGLMLAGLIVAAIAAIAEGAFILVRIRSKK